MKLFLLMVISIVVIFVPMAQAETPVDSTAYVFDCLFIRDMTMIYSSAEWNGGGSGGEWKFISVTGKWKGITGGGTWSIKQRVQSNTPDTIQNCSIIKGAYELPE